MGKKGKKNKGQGAAATMATATASGQHSANDDKNEETETEKEPVLEGDDGVSQIVVEELAKSDFEDTRRGQSPSSSLTSCEAATLPAIETESNPDTIPTALSDKPIQAGAQIQQDTEIIEAPLTPTPKSSREERAESTRRSPGRDSVNSSYDFADDDDDEWAWDDEDTVDANHELLASLEEENERLRPQIEEICAELRDFLFNLADQKVRDYVNKQLTQVKFKEFISYYLENEELGRYTINAELNRMDFTVVYGGQRTADKAEVVLIYEQTPMHDLWKLANQSIYTELLSALQHTYANPELSINIISQSSRFVLNLDTDTLSAESVFAFVTVQDPRHRPVKGIASERLELASVRGTVKVDLGRHKSVSFVVDDPKINMIFDADLYAAAKCILSYRSTFQGSGDLAELRAARERLLETSRKGFQHGRALLSRSTRVGMAALEGVVGSIGRLIGAGSSENTPLSLRPDDRESISNSYSYDDHCEAATMSFDDFIAHDEEGQDGGEKRDTKSGGSWFTSAAVGLVGGLGKLLGADKDADKTQSLFSRPNAANT